MRAPRLLLALLALAVVAAGAFTPGAGAAKRPTNAQVRSYMVKVTVEIRRYQAAVRRAEGAFGSSALQHPEAVAERLAASRAEFARLALRFGRVRPPASLRRSHTKMTQALQVTGRAFGDWGRAHDVYAKSEDLGALLQANTRAKAELARAGSLQRQWGTALRAAARRARVPLPSWLRTLD